MKKFIVKKGDGTTFGLMGDSSGVTGAFLTIGNDFLALIAAVSAFFGLIGTLGAIFSKK